MVQLNGRNEVADFLDVSQFIGGHSAYECVAYSAALIKFCGAPGKGPSGSTLAASNLAQYWYGREEGSNAASNTNGMSVPQEYDMLTGLGLKYQPLDANLAAVKAALQRGTPVLLCGSEVGMHDLDLADRVPYSWTPSGNHAIVASGIGNDGSLLVHDCASIAPTGVRPGPRRYDPGKLQIVSATAVIMPWFVEDDMIDINSPNVGIFFEETDPQHWKCKQTGNIVQYAVLDFYKKNNGLLLFGLPLSNEVVLNAQGDTKQYYERACLVYNQSHSLDNPPGSGMVYTAHVYADGALGEDPLIPKLQATITQLQSQPPTDTVNADKVAKIKVIVNA